MPKIQTLIFTAILASLLFSFPLPVLAVDDETITENLKKRLQETVSTAKNQEPPLSSYKSFVGVIRDVIKDTIIIEDKDGEKSIRIASGSALLRAPGNSTIKTEDIRLEDYCIAIGKLDPTDTNEMDSLRLIVSTSPLTTTAKTTGLATISKINKNTFDLTPLGGGEIKTITLDSDTTLKSPLGDALVIKDINVGDSILYTATLEEKSITATNIMRIGFATEPSSSPSN